MLESVCERRATVAFCAVPSVSSGAFHVQCCVLSARASLSLCDRWQRLQDTNLASKLFSCRRSLLSLSAGRPGAPGADKAACCLAGRLLWASFLFPRVVNSVSSLLLCHWANFNATCLCVYWFPFFVLVLCASLTALSVWLSPTSLSRQKELKAI